MSAFRLLLLLLVFPWLNVAAQGQTHLRLSLGEDRPELFVPGDEVLLVAEVSGGISVASDTLTVTLDLPQGLRSTDVFWRKDGQRLSRRVATPGQGQGLTLGMTARILPDFRGKTLSVTGRIIESDTVPTTIRFSVAKLLNSLTDTCLNLRDTSLMAINTLLSTSNSITARPDGPIDLSPTRPIRVSAKPCAALKLGPTKRKKKPNDKCSCLVYRFTGTDGKDYPPRYTPDGGRLQSCVKLESAGRKGDTISITVKTIAGRPLRDLMLTDGGGRIIDVAQDAATLSFETILTEDTAAFHLYLRSARKWFVFPPKQYVMVGVTRKPSAVTMRRGKGGRVTQPGLDTLSREIVEKAPGVTTWLKTVAHREAGGTVVYRIKETISATGALPPVLDTISRDSCPGPFSIQQQERIAARFTWVATDTLLAQVADLSGQVDGKRNPIGRQGGSLEIKVPLQLDITDPPGRDSLIALAYWVGIGEPPLAAYNLLAEEVPPEWSQPGVSPPLAAYGLGHPVVLPGMKVGKDIFQTNYVAYDFVSGPGLSAFQAGRTYRPVINRLGGRPNYGLVTGAELTALGELKVYDPETDQRILRFHVAFTNQHEINTYRLRAILVGYYQVKVPGQTWVR